MQRPSDTKYGPYFLIVAKMKGYTTDCQNKVELHDGEISLW